VAGLQNTFVPRQRDEVKINENKVVNYPKRIYFIKIQQNTSSYIVLCVNYGKSIDTRREIE
jgi:hypothetical protein